MLNATTIPFEGDNGTILARNREPCEARFDPNNDSPAEIFRI